MSLYSTASAYAKDVWEPTFEYQLERSAGSMLQLLGLNKTADPATRIEGRRAYMKLKIGDDLGFGVITQGGDFPTPGDVTADEATLTLAQLGSTILFDEHEMQQLDSLTAAAAPIMAEKMSSAKARILREVERMSIMDGSGKLGKVASVSSTSLVFDVAGSEYPERNAYTWIDDANRSRYTIADASTGADEVQGFTISNLVESTNTATCSTSVAAAEAADYVVTDYGASKWTSGGAFTSPEFPGLLGLIDDDNTYLAIDRTAAGKGYWKSVVDANGGTLRPITETLVGSVMSKLMRRSETGMIGDGYCGLASPGVWNAYQFLMSGALRYSMSDSPDINWGSREVISFNGIPLYKHIHAPRNQVLLVHKPSVMFLGSKHNRTNLFEFYTRDGGIFFQANAASGQGHATQVYAYLHGFLSQYTRRPRNFARLDDITESAGAY